ncbi:MAG: hypothetical protein U0793_24860 [Gemmataceae bacterium]
MKKLEIQSGMTVEDLVVAAKKSDVVLTVNGHAVALLSDFDDDELYWYEREHAPDFIASIARARQEVAEGKTIKHDDLMRELGIENE